MTPFWVTLGTSVVLTGLAIPVLKRAQFLDLPNHRSSHAVPTPRGGGVAVMVAVAVGFLAGGRPVGWALLLPALLMAAVGLADDLLSLPSRARLAAQLVLGTALGLWVAADVGTARLSTALFVVVCLLGFVSYVNAFNFMDGVNGISALNAAVAGGWYTWLGHGHELPVATLLGAAVTGAALGFLPWNASARVFLGDVGSYGLGALLAGLAVYVWVGGVPASLAVAPLLVYLADTAWVILRRARAGKPLTQAHREHAYQRLVQQGWPHLGAAAWSAGVAGAASVVMAWLYPDHRTLALLAAAALVLGYLASPRVNQSGRARDGVVST